MAVGGCGSEEIFRRLLNVLLSGPGCVIVSGSVSTKYVPSVCWDQDVSLFLGPQDESAPSMCRVCVGTRMYHCFWVHRMSRHQVCAECVLGPECVIVSGSTD